MQNFQGPTPSGQAVNAQRTDGAYQAREAAKREAAKSPEERELDAVKSEIADLKKMVQAITFTCGQGLSIIGNAPSFAANFIPDPPPQNIDALTNPYPWIKSIYDTVAKVYAVIFGKGTSSFSVANEKDIKQFEMVVADPADATASAMQTIIGDADPATNDQQTFKGNGNTIKMQWISQPEQTFIFKDGGGNINTAYVGVRGGSPTIELTSFTGDKVTIQPFNAAGALALQPIHASDGAGGFIDFYGFQ